jgi:D-sedoheptulose 7-phosphate isomerase
LCGNGGSAADAQHVAGELMKGFLDARRLPATRREALETASAELGPYLADRLQSGVPAIALDGHGPLLTAVANDNGGDLIFAQQVEALGAAGDVLWAFTTSGTSRNILLAAVTARSLGLRVIGMTGDSGGALAPLCDVCLCVPARETFLVQEYHLPLYHALCAAVEEALFSGSSTQACGRQTPD